jgi:DNA-binding MarR family transcriptional regulator
LNIMSMGRDAERDLEILTAIEEGKPLTQRAVAKRLGMALGLANLYVKRLVTKGFVKVKEFPSKPAAGKRFRYVLTPRGVAEKTRLTYTYMTYSLQLYRRARANLREAMASLPDRGMKRIVLYGTGDAAELAYLTLKEFGLEPVAVFAREGGGQFLGFGVRGVADLSHEEFDGLIIATFERPEQHIAELARLGHAPEKFLTLRRLAAPVPRRAVVP